MIIVRNISTFLFTLAVFTAIYLGWQQRSEYWLSPEDGWGYALGIIGGSLILVLLLYPLRKRWKLARNWFSIRYWFKMHILCGVLGPLLILFHCNFSLGSLNSNIALFSMLLVSSSGVIGRYAYQKIHRGLYGAQIDFSALKDSFEKSKTHFEQSALLDGQTKAALSEIEINISKRTVPFLDALVCYRRIKKILKQMHNKSRDEAAHSVDKQKLLTFTHEAKQLLTGLIRLKRMANYSLYARVFSLWHIFHLPIFFMMLVAAVVHIFSVHMY